MADVTGPISTLAGSSHEVPEGMMCDEHLDRPAVARIQGETDSLGCEMEDLCQQCIDDRRAYRRSEAGRAEEAEWRTGQCEWCGGQATDLRDARDYEEGICGRVYRVCGACIKRVNDEVLAEFDHMDGYDPRDDYDDSCGKCYGEGETFDFRGTWRGYCLCEDGLRLKTEAEARYQAESAVVTEAK